MLPGSKEDHLRQIRKDIASFKSEKKLDQVIVLWTANTERFSELLAGVNDTADNMLRAIEAGHAEISPSTLFAVAAALEGVSIIINPHREAIEIVDYISHNIIRIPDGRN